MLRRIEDPGGARWGSRRPRLSEPASKEGYGAAAFVRPLKHRYPESCFGERERTRIKIKFDGYKSSIYFIVSSEF